MNECEGKRQAFFPGGVKDTQWQPETAEWTKLKAVEGGGGSKLQE